MRVNVLKTYTKIVLLCVCLWGCCGCDAIYRLLQKEGAQERDLVGEVTPLDLNENVEKVQKLLKLFGYSIGEPDGILGGRTRDTIEDFQNDQGLPPSRFIDKATWERLHQFEELGLVVEEEVNVAKMQEALKKAGFDVGAIDGRMGQRTQQAIRKFQEKNGLKPDGKVGIKTLTSMSRYLATPNTKSP
ncbi:MAG: peptidoglycan-binding protein [Candidatus Omnitrophica bacterium]|nr:peptidoglycan-binding protein [Candidatus Omnitrophota bacterium]